MIYKIKCFQSTFEGLGFWFEWESVPGFGVCKAEGSLAELESRSRQNRSRFEADFKARVDSVKTGCMMEL